MVPDAEFDGTRLARELDALFAPPADGGPARLEEMSRAARTVGRPDAADRLADLVEEIAHGA